MSKPLRTISIHCAKCRTLLYKYHKGGTGGLVKCFEDLIAEDNTNGDLRCPNCEQEFARLRIIQNKRAHKIIQGKIYTKGMTRK
jgi:endo-1,4-beta-mannosidase